MLLLAQKKSESELKILQIGDCHSAGERRMDQTARDMSQWKALCAHV